MSKSVSTNVFKKKTGIQNIQAYLESGRSITPLEALSNFGIFRLATAINSLRKRGLPIETEMKKDPNGKTYARYVLGEEKKVEEVAPKFNVGDRVEFSNKNRDEKDVGVVVGFLVGHLAFPYEVRLEALGWLPCAADELTLLPTEAPKKELKVGARVRVIGGEGFDSFFEEFFQVGDEGTVLEVTEDVDAHIQFDKGYAATNSRITAWHACLNHLEVI